MVEPVPSRSTVPVGQARLRFDFNKPFPLGLIIIPVRSTEKPFLSATVVIMNGKQKYLLIVLVGWIVPIACILAGRSSVAIALAAVPIAWWHGYVAARFEQKLAVEK